MGTTISRTIQDPYVAVGFYGIRIATEVLRAWYESALAWFQEKELLPDIGAVGGEGFSGKSLRFVNADRKLRKMEFSDVKWLEVVAMTEDGTDVVKHSVLSIGWSDRIPCVTLEASGAVASLDDVSLFSLMKQWHNQLDASYGIGLAMNQGRGPGFYLAGMGYHRGDAPPPTSEEIEYERRRGDWGTIGTYFKVYNQGVLRDVYPWNFLSDRHVSRDFEGQAFGDWIRKDRARGTLEQVAEGKWFWCVPRGNVQDIRAILWGSNFIFKREDYVQSSSARDHVGLNTKTRDGGRLGR